ncbi:MAG: hypothetical protein IJ786_00225 [Bacteroidaceae bacterium]|nr:hypothetical protein [Bacteroidaceae bacterium]
MIRDNSFSILKAFAVILLVLTSCTPWPVVSDFVGLVAMPAFFLCVGYFFNTEHVNRPAEYVERRARQLYFPFLKWAIALLLLHNLWFYVGVLSETQGTATAVSHPYSWNEFSQRLWSVLFNMSGYDDLLCETFWVFRAMLLANVGFLVLFILGRKISRFENDKEIGWAIFTVSFLAVLWLVVGKLVVTGVAGGGYRELLALFFICCGFLFRQYRGTVEVDWRTYLLCLCIWIPVAWFYPVSMTAHTDLLHFIALPLPAFAGFMLLLGLAEWVGRYKGIVNKLLVYIGDNYLCVIAFYLLAFKFVSMLKVGIYGLSWSQIAQHPVVEGGHWWDGLWLCYLVVGVAFPLLVRYFYLRLTEGRRWSFGRWGDLLFDMILLVGVTLLKILRGITLGIYHFFLNFFRALGEFLKASSPKDE